MTESSGYISGEEIVQVRELENDCVVVHTLKGHGEPLRLQFASAGYSATLDASNPNFDRLTIPPITSMHRPPN